MIILGTMCGYNYLLKAIKPDEMFGAWQHVIEYFNGKGYFKVAMFLGDCPVCFAHFISWLSFILNAVILQHIWAISTANLGNVWIAGIANVFYALLYVASSWRLCLTQIEPEQ